MLSCCGTAILSYMQFGNMMLVAGLLPANLLSAIALASIPFQTLRLHIRCTLGGSLLAMVTLIVKTGLSIFASGARSDKSHIWQLLLAKYDDRNQTFDTKVYLCSPEFGFYGPAALAAGLGIIVPAAL
jgi:hypothetical protein